MANSMHAAVVEAFGKPLAFHEWAIPAPGPGEILVKTEACGVCHTDLHAAKGDWPLKPTLPLIPGHEGIGLAAAVGSGVKSVKEGDRVGVPWLFSGCGHCEHCLKAWETVCGSAEFGGYTKNGGFTEDGRLADATALGADLVVNAEAPDAIEAVRKGTSGSARGVLITAPSRSAFKQGIGMARKRGTCVLVGLPPGDFPVPLFDVVAEIEVQPLSAINAVFDRLEHGEVPARIVIEF